MQNGSAGSDELKGGNAPAIRKTRSARSTTLAARTPANPSSDKRRKATTTSADMEWTLCWRGDIGEWL